MKILIGDSKELFRAGLRLLLGDLDDVVTFDEAGTFNETVDRCRTGGRYDLILIDGHLPGQNGIGSLKALQPQTPVVVLSASAEPGDICKAMDHEASGVILKSCGLTDLKETLALALASAAPVPPPGRHGCAEGEERLRTLGARYRTSQLLSPRQHDVLTALRTGMSNRQIACDLRVSESTIKIHMTAIFKLLGVRNRTEAVIVTASTSVRQ